MCRCFIPLLACLLVIPTAFARSPHQSTGLVVDLINQFRNVNGLSSLRVNSELTAAAQEHADNMSFAAFVSHYDADGNRADVRAVRAGYTGRVTELIFGSSGGEARAVEWWQGSELHRSLLLSSRYAEIGVGATVNANDGWTYWAVVLGDGASGTVETNSNDSGGSTEAASTDTVDPSVLLPTATAVNTPIPLPTNTPVPIPTVTPLPTIAPVVSLPTAEPTLAATAVVIAPPTAVMTTAEIALVPPTQTVELASSDTSSPDTIPSVDLDSDSESPAIFADESATSPNWLVFIVLAISMIGAPLFIYFWLGNHAETAE